MQVLLEKESLSKYNLYLKQIYLVNIILLYNSINYKYIKKIIAESFNKCKFL